MKQRIFAVLLAVALLVTVGALAVHAASLEDADGNCVCGCGALASDIVWEDWNGRTAMQTAEHDGKHYRLTQDVVNTDGQIKIGDDTATEVAVEVTIDLNGHKLIHTNKRVFSLYDGSTLNIVGDGTVSGAHTTDIGATISLNAGSTLNLYGGVLTTGNTANAKNGGVVAASAGSTINMYNDATIIGGPAKQGGSVYLTGAHPTETTRYSALNMYDNSLITGGYAEVSGASGGNVYANTSTTVLMEDNSAITNGRAGSATITCGGGNISTNAAFVTIRDNATISNGYSTGTGGNIANGGASTFNIEGGNILDGVSGTFGDCIYINNKGATLNISGGVIEGDVNASAIITLSGAPKILMTNKGGLVIRGAAADITNLTADAEIFLSATASRTVATGYNPEIHANCFKNPFRTLLTFDSENGKITADPAGSNTGYCPHCYDPENPQPATWTALTAPTAGTADINWNDAAHYYLTDAISFADRVRVYGDVVLDLNGKSWTKSNSGEMPFWVRGQFAVMDSVGGGSIVGKGNGGYTGGIAYVYADKNTRFDLYSGTLNYNDTAGIGTSGGVHVNGATFNMYGGTIKNGKSTGNGGSIGVTGNAAANIYGGAVLGGSAVNGGSIYLITAASKVNISGGHIAGGTASGNGGNIFVQAGVLNVSGGVIGGGSAVDGGAIYADQANAEASITGGIVRGGTASGNGGTVYMNEAGSAVTFEGDVFITAGTATGSGNAVYNNGGTLTMKLANNVGACHQLCGEVLVLKGRGFACGHGATVVDIASGDRVWYCTNADAVKICGSDSTEKFINLHGNEELVLDGNYVVNINTHHAVVSGTGTLYGIDGTVSKGYITVAEGADVTVATHAANPSTKLNFVTLLDEETGKYTFHPLDMNIKGVTLKTKTGGMYYDAAWKAEEAIADKVEQFGIAVKVGEQPTADFATDNKTLYSWIDNSARTNNSLIVDGTLVNGAVLNNIIVKNNQYVDSNGETVTREQTNDVHAKTQIFAVPYAYVEMYDGSYAYIINETVISRSLDDIVNGINAEIVELEASDVQEKQTTAAQYKSYMNSFCNTWCTAANNLDGMGWTYDEYVAGLETPAE